MPIFLPLDFVDLWAVVLEADFFLWAVEVLSCARAPLPSRANTMASTTTLEVAVGIHRIQCSAICSRPGANKSFTKWIPDRDICRTRPSVQ